MRRVHEWFGPRQDAVMWCRAALCLAVLLGAAAAPAQADAEAAWTKEEQATFYHLPEGSEIFPIDWLAVLKSSRTKKLFVEDLGRFGFLDDPKGAPIRGTGKRLPIGMTVARTATLKVQMIGVNCAACHVGQVSFEGKSLVIEGAPNMLNIADFYQEIFDSVEQTLQNPLELIAFLKRLKDLGADDDPTKLLVAMLPGLKEDGVVGELESIILQRLRAQLTGGSSAGPHGLAGELLKLAPAPGRPDAIELARELLEDQRKRAAKHIAGIEKLTEALGNKGKDLKGELGEALARLGVERLAMIEARVAFLRRLKEIAPGQAQYRPGPGRVDAFVTARNLLFEQQDIIPPNSAVSFPHLWGLSKFGWLHWDGNTNSIMERNVGQSLGLGAVAVRGTNHSTVLPKNLHALEELAKKIRPPEWPATALGAKAIDPALAGEGKKLYTKHCASCHDRQEGAKVVQGSAVYLASKIGTDPQRVKNFAEPLSGNREFTEGLSDKLRRIKEQAYKDAGLSPEVAAGMDLPPGKIKWLTTGGYVARPLAGAWATAPYLHNGSVPTLDDLLKPADDRPRFFPLGHREYDLEKLGYVSDLTRVPREQLGRIVYFDAGQLGNSNAGHEYGQKRFDATERKALLEYLKTLK